ncbi:MAG: hypothetical protein KBH07_12135 [Flavobacteriales bacterium]|nr:hypothetical protein [Flavobacteriales bacterium]MBP9081228.1 hypothetical protein [Flavobacteriales bacterium]
MRPARHATPYGRAACRWAVLLLPALWLATPVQAQLVPSLAAFQFSNGVHPTFDATFESTSERDVSRFWYNELKAASMRVTNKKEMVGYAARIPAASTDTLQVLIAVERSKAFQSTTVHIAFFTRIGYIGPDSPERELGGCMEWVRQRMVSLQRQLAQTAVAAGQRDLGNLSRQLDMLQREEQRMENSLRRTRQRMEQAAKDSTQSAEQLAQLAMAPDTAGTDSATRAAQDKQRRKDLARWQDRSKRSAYTKQDMQQKEQDLQWALKKSKEDQAAKQAQVERQEAVVRDLREKMQAIR